MVILKIVRYISAFDYYEGIYWFCAKTFESKMLQYFTETSESHSGYFQLRRHILRHLRHLLALCWKSHKPPFRLAQLISKPPPLKYYIYVYAWDTWYHLTRYVLCWAVRNEKQVKNSKWKKYIFSWNIYVKSNR